MTRKGFVGGILAVLLLCVGQVGAIGEPIRTLQDVATIMPDDTALFMAMDISEAALGDVETVINRVVEQLPPFLGITTVDLEGELRRALQQIVPLGSGYLREGIGRYIAISMTSSAIRQLIETPEAGLVRGIRFYVQVDDRVSLERGLPYPYLGEGREQRGNTIYNTIFDTTVVLNDEWLTLYTDFYEPRLTRSLAKQTDYQRLVAEVVDETYGGLLYANEEAVRLINAQSDGAPELQEISNQPLLIGFGLDEQRTLFLDAVQVVSAESAMMQALPAAPVDLEFLRAVRADADLVIQLTDVTAYLDYFIVAFESLASPLDMGREMRETIDQIEAVQNDIDWMTGEAVLYTTLDLEAFSAIGSGGNVDALPFEFAFVAETDDARAAQRTWTRLVEAVTPDAVLQVGTTTVNGVQVDTVTALIPVERDTLPLEMLFGVHDGLAFIATPGLADFLTREDEAAALSGEKDFRHAAGWFLPQTRQLLYSSEDGLTLFTALFAALASDMLLPSDMNLRLPASPYVQTGEQTEALQTLRAIFRSASITSRLHEDVQVTRLALTID